MICIINDLLFSFAARLHAGIFIFCGHLAAGRPAVINEADYSQYIVWISAAGKRQTKYNKNPGCVQPE